MRGIRVVEGALSGARGTRVGVFDITAMSMAIVPILISLVGVGGMRRPTPPPLLALVRGWLLQVAASQNRKRLVLNYLSKLKNTT